MNTPNILTLIRIVLAIPFIYFLEQSVTLSTKYELIYRWIALSLFSLASITDFFDGYLARKHNLITDFGKLMDPLADKILVISALVVFVEIDYIPAWMSIVVITREFLISGIRTLAAAKGEVIPAGKLGKYKTTAQMIVIIAMMFFGKNIYNYYIMLIPVGLTVWSGWEYTLQTKHYFLNLK